MGRRWSRKAIVRAYSDTERGQIHLRIFPSRVAAARPALVCLHPFPYSGSFFETIAPLLGAGRVVCAPDCPGYGGSDPPSGMLSMEEIATTMHQALAACRNGFFRSLRSARISQRLPAGRGDGPGLSRIGYGRWRWWTCRISPPRSRPDAILNRLPRPATARIFQVWGRFGNSA